MEVSECWIKAEDDDEWTVISDCSVHMSVARRIQRTIVRGSEGDDILDEGSESAVFTVRGVMSLEDHRNVLRIFRRGGARHGFAKEELQSMLVVERGCRIATAEARFHSHHTVRDSILSPRRRFQIIWIACFTSNGMSEMSFWNAVSA